MVAFPFFFKFLFKLKNQVNFPGFAALLMLILQMFSLCPGSTSSWKICEVNTPECWKRQRKIRYIITLLLCEVKLKKNKKQTKQLLQVRLVCLFLQLLLTNQLEMEKMKVEQEKKKCYMAQEALKEKVLTPVLLPLKLYKARQYANRYSMKHSMPLSGMLGEI